MTGNGALQNFSVTHKAQHPFYVINVRFQAYGGYYAGGMKVLLSKYEAHFTDSDHRIMAIIDDMAAWKSEPIELHLRIWQEPVPWKERDSRDDNATARNQPELHPKLLKTFKHLPNTPNSTFFPNSFYTPPFAAFHNASNKFQVQAGAKIHPPCLVNLNNSNAKQPPAPMTSLYYSNPFRTIDAARLKLSLAVENEYQKARLKLQFFCQSPHLMRLYSCGSITVATIKSKDFKKLSENPRATFSIDAGTHVEMGWASTHAIEGQSASGVVVHLQIYIPDCDLTVMITNRETASFKLCGRVKAWEDTSN